MLKSSDADLRLAQICLAEFLCRESYFLRIFKFHKIYFTNFTFIQQTND